MGDKTRVRRANSVKTPHYRIIPAHGMHSKIIEVLTCVDSNQDSEAQWDLNRDARGKFSNTAGNKNRSYFLQVFLGSHC